MKEYYGSVSVHGSATSHKNRYFSTSIVEGGGSCRSNDLHIARNLSKDLTHTVNNAITYAYDIHKR